MMISKVRSARRIATEGDALSAYPRDEQWHSPIERYQSRKTARGVDERGVIHAFPGRKRPAFGPCAINPPSFVASRHAGTRSLDNATGRATTHLCAHALPRTEMTGSAISRSDFQEWVPASRGGHASYLPFSIFVTMKPSSPPSASNLTLSPTLTPLSIARSLTS